MVAERREIKEEASIIFFHGVLRQSLEAKKIPEKKNIEVNRVDFYCKYDKIKQ
ncbi:hypothetical protein KJ854_04055 [Patescibacteria group bacterium]|nr:hypothetical protein [Patescibacteria group bacterium]MBU4141368.1 hypothetical protein [Patescibacteria group bacterium]